MQSASKKGLARAARRSKRTDHTSGSSHSGVERPGDLPSSLPAGSQFHSSDDRPFVSRGGLKLAGALAASEVPVQGRRAIDIGASTGGFTDCLLRCGAGSVIAVDVGYGQLAWRLRTDPRVHVIERQNARRLTAAHLPHAPSLAVIDVSFISLAKVLPAVLSCLEPEHDILALIKPQFEVGKGRVGKGGVVREQSLRVQVLIDVAMAAIAMGERFRAFLPAPIAGPKGNLETFVWLAGASGDAKIESNAVIEREAHAVESARKCNGGAA